jgi:outer membrane protein W
MKKLLYVSLMCVFILASTTLYAAETYSLGNTNVALKVDYFAFTEDVFGDVDLDEGVYVGLEGYYGVMPDLYVGLEVGWAGTSNDGDINIAGEMVDTDVDVTLVPVELNLKYVIEASPEWIIGFGAGVSYNYFEVEVDPKGYSDADEDDWVWGGQLFAEVNYKMSEQWFLGVNGKYQWTEDLEFDIRGEDIETDTSADNWRVGAQIGMMF